MEHYLYGNILSYMTDMQVFQLSKQSWFKSWATLLPPRVLFIFPMRELCVKVDALKVFDCLAINDIFSCYKCLVGHNPLQCDKNIVGGTDYIDRVTIQDMSGVINIGVDTFSRPYCTISGYYTDGVFKNDSRYCFTMFQRYTNDKHVWQYGTCYPDILYTSGSLSSTHNKDVRDIIRAIIQSTGYVDRKSLYMEENQHDVLSALKYGVSCSSKGSNFLTEGILVYYRWTSAIL